MELIDREAMENDIAVCCHEHSGEYGGPCCGVCGLILKAPVVDAVEVVRCKDCRHMEADNGARFCHVWGSYNGMGDDGFCNYGKRRGK